MAIALGVHASGGSTDTNAITTAGINTSGHSLAVVGCSNFAKTNSVSDNKSNTWNALTLRGSASNTAQLFYSILGSVGSGHTFTLTSTGGFPGIAVVTFSGTDTSSPFDQQNGASNASATSLAPGSITPGVDNEVCVSIVTFDKAGLPMSNSLTWTILESVEWGSGTNEGIALAYSIQTTATAVNPSWTRTGSANPMAAAIASFKQAAAGGGRGLFLPPSLSGVGIGASFFRDVLQ